jgi:hypothetical protein
VSKRKKTFTITANDIPNPVAVKALQDAASAIADRIDETKPGMQTLKDFLPYSLLLYATSLGGFDLVMQDGTKVPVRSVDMQAAGMDMVARATGRYMSQLVGKRLADDKSLWGVAQYHRGKFVRFVDLDAHERAPREAVGEGVPGDSDGQAWGDAYRKPAPGTRQAYRTQAVSC